VDLASGLFLLLSFGAISFVMRVTNFLTHYKPAIAYMYALSTAGLSIRIVNLDWILTSIENIGNQYSFFNLSIYR